MAEPSVTPDTFADAVARAGAHRGKPVVVKLGGSAMEDPAAAAACLQSVATLHRLGVPLALVHGGGKPIDRAMAEAGLTPKKVAGRRYTDDATLEIVVRVLKDEINTALVARLQELGCPAVGVHAALFGERLLLPGLDLQPVDLGRVGAVSRVELGALGAGVPVIPSLAIDTDGGWLNVNADTAASAVAGALNAERAIFLTDTPGVLRDRANPDSLIPLLTEAQARDLIAEGVIDGGMVPKVEACFDALAAGAREALILDGRVPHSLLGAFLHDTFRGTAIRR